MLEFGQFLRADGINHLIGNQQRIYNVPVEYAHTTRSDRTHGQLWVTGQTEFANNKHVEWRVQFSGYFRRNRHATARQREHEHIGSIRVAVEIFSKKLASFSSVKELSFHILFPFVVITPYLAPSMRLEIALLFA
jgi:hypothetical protein